jgi:hypothetical protein
VQGLSYRVKGYDFGFRVHCKGLRGMVLGPRFVV